MVTIFNGVRVMMCSINCYCEEYEASRTVDPQPDVNDADDVIAASNPHDEREK